MQQPFMQQNQQAAAMQVPLMAADVQQQHAGVYIPHHIRAPPMPGGTQDMLMKPEDMVESIKYAREMANFMRAQATFWMENVRTIQSTSAPGMPPMMPPTNIPMMPGFLSGAAAAASSSSSTAPVATTTTATTATTQSAAVLAKVEEDSSPKKTQTTSTSAESKTAQPSPVFLPSTVAKPRNFSSQEGSTAPQEQQQPSSVGATGGNTLGSQNVSSESSQALPLSGQGQQQPDMSEIAKLRAARYERQKSEGKDVLPDGSPSTSDIGHC